MLTIMCPNCRHRFPAPGCCNPAGSVVMQTSGGDQFSTSCGGSYCSGNNEYLVQRGYLNGGGGGDGGSSGDGGGGVLSSVNSVNSPTIIHGPTIIQGHNQNEQMKWIETGCNNQRQQRHHHNHHHHHQQQQQEQQHHHPHDQNQILPNNIVDTRNLEIVPQHCKIGTTNCGSVTLAAINNNNFNKKLENNESFRNEESTTKNLQCGIFQNPHPLLFPAPSGCQELPGLGDNNSSTATTAFDFQISQDSDWTRRKNLKDPNLIHVNTNNINNNNSNNSSTISPSSSPSSSSSSSSNFSLINNSKTNINQTHPPPTVIQVNATLQLPPNVAHCTVSITATANATPISNNYRSRNNFNGGGIIETETSFGNVMSNTVSERDDNGPTTPVSWVLPFPWGVNGIAGNNSTDFERLIAAQKALQTSGWYHEGLSWQQSAALLKNSPVGSWLMRDSSDKRYMYAVSVQTARGPTAVRVHYVCGKFRLDAEPRMAPLMPMFDCPVKMIEHYIEYSKKMSEQKEVWVDHSGQLYSQIYLTKPLLKEVRSLSHLARLCINRNNISIKELPTPLKEYIADYPHTE